MVEKPALIENRYEEFADFLAMVAGSSERAEREMLSIFLDNVDLGRAQIDTLGEETVLSAPMRKNCAPEVYLCFRHLPRSGEANTSIAVEHKAIKAGDKSLHFEVYVHGKEGINSARPTRNMDPRIRNLDSIFVTSDWTEAAYVITGQLGGELRRRLLAKNPS